MVFLLLFIVLSYYGYAVGQPTQPFQNCPEDIPYPVYISDAVDPCTYWLCIGAKAYAYPCGDKTNNGVRQFWSGTADPCTLPKMNCKAILNMQKQRNIVKPLGAQMGRKGVGLRKFLKSGIYAELRKRLGAFPKGFGPVNPPSKIGPSNIGPPNRGSSNIGSSKRGPPNIGPPKRGPPNRGPSKLGPPNIRPPDIPGSFAPPNAPRRVGSPNGPQRAFPEPLIIPPIPKINPKPLPPVFTPGRQLGTQIAPFPGNPNNGVPPRRPPFQAGRDGDVVERKSFRLSLEKPDQEFSLIGGSKNSEFSQEEYNGKEAYDYDYEEDYEDNYDQDYKNGERYDQDYKTGDDYDQDGARYDADGNFHNAPNEVKNAEAQPGDFRRMTRDQLDAFVWEQRYKGNGRSVDILTGNTTPLPDPREEFERTAGEREERARAQQAEDSVTNIQSGKTSMTSQTKRGPNRAAGVYKSASQEEIDRIMEKAIENLSKRSRGVQTTNMKPPKQSPASSKDSPPSSIPYISPASAPAGVRYLSPVKTPGQGVPNNSTGGSKVLSRDEGPKRLKQKSEQGAMQSKRRDGADMPKVSVSPPVPTPGSSRTPVQTPGSSRKPPGSTRAPAPPRSSQPPLVQRSVSTRTPVPTPGSPRPPVPPVQSSNASPTESPFFSTQLFETDEGMVQKSKQASRPIPDKQGLDEKRQMTPKTEAESHLDAPNHPPPIYQYPPQSTVSFAKELSRDSVHDTDIVTPTPGQALNAPVPRKNPATTPNIGLPTTTQVMTQPPSILGYIGRPDFHRYFGVTEGIPPFVQLFHGEFVAGTILPTTTVPTTTDDVTTTTEPTTTTAQVTTTTSSSSSATTTPPLPATTTAAPESLLYPAPVGKFKRDKYARPSVLPSKWLAYPGYSISGATIGESAKSGDACLQRCMDRGPADCTAVDYDSSSGACWFHNALSGCGVPKFTPHIYHVKKAECAPPYMKPVGRAP